MKKNKEKKNEEQLLICKNTGNYHQWQDPSKNSIVACETCGVIKNDKNS